MSLQKLKDELSIAAHGITKAEGHEQGICVCCKLPALPRCHTEAGKREYGISGICEVCFDHMFSGEGNDDQ